MSMNLYCKQVELWLTPTYISYMCYSNNNGGWTGIYYRYVTWVKAQINGVWDDEYYYENMKSQIKYHIEQLEQAIIDYGKLDFEVR